MGKRDGQPHRPASVFLPSERVFVSCFTIYGHIACAPLLDTVFRQLFCVHIQVGKTEGDVPIACDVMCGRDDVLLLHPFITAAATVWSYLLYLDHCTSKDRAVSECPGRRYPPTVVVHACVACVSLVLPRMPGSVSPCGCCCLPWS